MQPDTYIKDVKRSLYLPPADRKRELKQLQEEINAGLDQGYSVLNVEDWMGEPDETAGNILDRYPAYHESPLAALPVILNLFCVLRIFHYLRFLGGTFLTAALFPEVSNTQQYVISGETAAEAASAIGPVEGIILCLVAIAVCTICYYWLKYTPESK